MQNKLKLKAQLAATTARAKGSLILDRTVRPVTDRVSKAHQTHQDKVQNTKVDIVVDRILNCEDCTLNSEEEPTLNHVCLKHRGLAAAVLGWVIDPDQDDPFASVEEDEVEVEVEPIKAEVVETIKAKVKKA